MTTDPQPSRGARLTVRRGVWLAGTVLVGALLLAGIDGQRFARALLAADPVAVAVVVGVALLVLLFRGLALGALLGILGHSAPTHRIVSAYAVTTVVSTVAPGGRAGGAPVNGHVVAQVVDADYEEGVVAVVAASLLSTFAVGAFGLFGLVSLLATTGGGTVTRLGAVGVGLFALATLGVVCLWYVRGRLRSAVVTAAVSVGRACRMLPWVPSPDREAVERRVQTAADAIARLRAGPPHRVAVVVALLAAAHGLTVVALWVSFVAVGQAVSPGVLLAVIPVAVLTAVVPAPGGISGVDVALVGLLTAGTAAVGPVVGAAVLVYRTATSGPALLVGVPFALATGLLGWTTTASDGAN